MNRLAYIAWLAFGWGGWVSSYRSFLEKYPYCWRQIWSFLLFDLVGPFVDIYVYLTMNNDNWLTRVADTQDIKVQDVDSDGVEDLSENPEKLMI